ncbi:diguanylate phosphodiesterase [Thiogranum longum]|uniref:Diguanylate phosphodiesterase n=1 Tax=Thiogranum longum TaxID=1537524 RepID=A0A4R1H9C0_9GAMM|nr:HDOD domain-containing protein [Thiogranum longum]TCK17111.1 diguanylate phosphodiesterase [Thiogranum longum]
MSEIFIGRQPIYDRQQGVYAYELLFRSAQQNVADITDGDKASSDVIVNTFMEIGLDNIVGDRLAFINLTRAFFVGETTISLPKDRVVLELLEDIEADEDVVAGVTRLRQQGYSIALDDFIYHESLQPLVELADIIKIDIMALDQDEIRAHVTQLRKYPLRLLAEKVETRDEFDFCMALGFDYFQGYFFAQPKIIRSQRLPNNRLAILELMSRLQNPDITPEELENLIARDITFSFKILRYVNSAAIALPRKIESIQQAVVILGLKTIRSWVTLLAMSQIDDKPTELIVIAMIRAKMAENMARARNETNIDAYFTVGLFSALDALMDNSMEEILTQLPLADHIRDALLHRRGNHGKTLGCVLAYERGDWENIHCEVLKAPEIRDAYLSAVRWANETCQTLVND